MSNPNKDTIDVLNDLIEYSKDGEKGFKTSAEDVKNPQLKAFFVQRASECASAAAELQSEVRRLGGDPETSTSISGDLHRGWVNLKSMVTGKDEEAVLAHKKTPHYLACVDKLEDLMSEPRKKRSFDGLLPA